MSVRQRANISGWLQENTNFEINSVNLEALTKLPTPSFHEKADKLLRYFEIETSYAGEAIRITETWVSKCWCINENELNEVVNFLKQNQRINELGSYDLSSIKIMPEGWAHLETFKHKLTSSDQCFVAMWFSDEMKQVYDSTIAVAILEAGYRPHRVDQREHNEKIDDEIIAQIRRSRFVLADFTGHRGGVYFEAGFAKGLNLEVVWTCREDELDKLHFDIRQYNCIVWNANDQQDLRKKITNRIEAVFGRVRVFRGQYIKQLNTLSPEYLPT